MFVTGDHVLQRYSQNMNAFFEAKLAVCFLCFTALSVIWPVKGAFVRCTKDSECSCRTNGQPQKEISLWQMKSQEKVVVDFSLWQYDVNLCRGIKKNSDAKNGGCQNSAVCQYDDNSSEETFDIGQFGNVTFSQYDTETKSIKLLYHGVRQKNVTRSITITLQCDEKGNITHADYYDFGVSLFDETKFVGKIRSKAACLRPVKPDLTKLPTSMTKSMVHVKTTTTLTPGLTTQLPTLEMSLTTSHLSARKSGISTVLQQPATMKSDYSKLLSRIPKPTTYRMPTTALTTKSTTSISISMQHIVANSDIVTTSTMGFHISRTSKEKLVTHAPKTQIRPARSSTHMQFSTSSSPTVATPTSGSLKSKQRMKTEYVVLIVVLGFILVVIAIYFSYKQLRRKREKNLADKRCNSEDDLAANGVLLKASPSTTEPSQA